MSADSGRRVGAEAPRVEFVVVRSEARGPGGAMPGWDDYRYFLAVAETGSFTAAAGELRLSTTAVSRRVSDLE